MSRGQEDIAHIDSGCASGASGSSLCPREVNELHIGLKGMMGALYLKDLGEKTRRGLRGRVEAGKSGGGDSYGYDVVRKIGNHPILEGPDDAPTVDRGDPAGRRTYRLT